MPACLHCGREVSPRATACPQCGEPGPAATASASSASPPLPPAAYPPPPGSAPSGPGRAASSAMASVNRTEPFAIASIACAVGNFVGAFLVGAVLGIVFGKIAQKNIAANPALEGASLARAGIIVGWVGVGIVGAFLLLGITAFGFFGGAFSNLPVHFTG
jgi:hypothetical protein